MTITAIKTLAINGFNHLLVVKQSGFKHFFRLVDISDVECLIFIHIYNLWNFYYAVHKISDGSSNSNKISKIADNKLDNTKQSGIIKFEKGVTEEVQNASNTGFEAMQEKFGKFGKITTISRVGVLNSKNSTDYGVFYDNFGELLLKFANKKNALSEHAQKAQEMRKSGNWSLAHPLHTFRHEIAHAIQLEHRLNDPLWDDKLEQIRAIMMSLPEFNNSEFQGKYSVSKYAMKNLDEFISECVAESISKKSSSTAKQVAKIIIGGD